MSNYSDADRKLLQSVGGWQVYQGNTSTPVWNFGWKPHYDLPRPQLDSFIRSSESLVQGVDIQGRSRSNDTDRAFLFDLWKHPLVRDANGFEFPGVHQLTGSCLPAGAPVRMSDGSEKPIEQVEVGDEVISHTGAARQVLNTFNRLFTGEMITFQAKGYGCPVTVTADHQVAIHVRSSDKEQLQWKRADQIQPGDNVLIGWSREESKEQILDLYELLGEAAVDLDELMLVGNAPVSNVGMAQWVCRTSGTDWTGRVKAVRSRTVNALKRYVPVGPALGRLIGLYLAEGCVDKGRVVFTFSHTEEHYARDVVQLVDELFGVTAKIVRPKMRMSVCRVHINNTSLAHVFKALVPGNVYTKRVPSVFFRADQQTKEALLVGWMDGDGYIEERKNGIRIEAVTVCQELARDFVSLAFSCGIKATLRRRPARKHSKTAYEVFLVGTRAVSLFEELNHLAPSKRAHWSDHGWTRFGYCRPVTRITKEDVTKLPVFDIEVEEDHSFLAFDTILHNCVGAAGGNMLLTLAAREAVTLGQPETPLIPFWLLPYGRSRYYLGDRGRGEGSTGSTFAKACLVDGVVQATHDSVPKFQNSDGLIWGRDVELSWSDGDASQTMNLLPQSRKHLVRTAAVCRNADDVREAIVNGYPVTCASMWGGMMQCPLQGNPQVLLNKRVTQWAHQQSILGWWQHPSLGEIYWVQNQWGKGAHGKDPFGPAGGYWVLKPEVDWMCRDDEVIAFSSFDGFPAPQGPLVWVF